MTTALTSNFVWDELYIDGIWRSAHAPGSQDVISPVSEESIGRVPNVGERDADAAVLAARRAFDEGPWPRRGVAERVEVMRNMGNIMRRRRDELVEVFVAETGMVHSIAGFFIDDPIDFWMDMVDRVIPAFPFVEPVAPYVKGSQIGQGAVHREPFGVVTAIPASNGPWNLALYKLAPALGAGCTVVLMPSPFNPMMSFLLAEIADEAGLDPGVLNVVPGSPDVGRVLTSHPGVDMVSFTGSDATGRAIAAQAAPTLKKVVLELGGKSACIVCEDADLDGAASNTLLNFTAHSGQGCGLLTRTLVHESIHDELVDRVQALLAHVTIGDPADPTVMLGPVISAVQREKVERLIAEGVAEGAKIVAGGGRPEHLDRGFYIEPTLMVGVENSMSVAQEEFFGPVGVVIPFSDDDEAVQIANDSRYGLSAGVWSDDPARAYAIAQRLRTGMVLINGGGPFPNPDSPFGGYKSSGLGRELGRWGLDEYLQHKTVSWQAGKPGPAWLS